MRIFALQITDSLCCADDSIGFSTYVDCGQDFFILQMKKFDWICCEMPASVVQMSTSARHQTVTILQMTASNRHIQAFHMEMTTTIVQLTASDFRLTAYDFQKTASDLFR